MSKHDMIIPFLSLLLGGICLSASPGYNNDNYPTDYPQNIKPGVSDDSSYYYQQQYGNSANRQKQIAYIDDRDRDIHQRANRKGDWGYKQNWRYDRRAFYKGETQGEAYEEEHPEHSGGIGMDPDREFLQMRQFYLEDARRARQNANRLSKNDQKNQNQSSKSGYANNNPSNRGNPNNHVANNDHSQRNGYQGNQNNTSQNKGASNNRSYRPNNFDTNAIADNYFDKKTTNSGTKSDASKQNTSENNSNSFSQPDRTPRYYYYYE